MEEGIPDTLKPGFVPNSAEDRGKQLLDYIHYEKRMKPAEYARMVGYNIQRWLTGSIPRPNTLELLRQRDPKSPVLHWKEF